jgi:glycosyltransferase involved in cell wall biosynthesis
MDSSGRDDPLVSVIMIFFDVDTTFFQEAIESVLQQTYDSWELLLVDDGSSNGSTDVARRYAREHPDRVRYLEHEGHENRGMSAARNVGMRNATGKYIALLDADDLWLPQKLAKQVGTLEAQPEAGMVFGSSWEWHSWTGNPEHALHDRGRQLGVEPDTLVNPPRLVTLFLRREAETPGTCSALMRRKLVDDVGGFEESFPGLYEDQAFFYKVCLEVPVFVESGCWDRYRKHPDSACLVAEADGRYDPHQPHSSQAIFLNWLVTYLAGRNVDDPHIHRALREALRPYRRLA